MQKILICYVHRNVLKCTHMRRVYREGAVVAENRTFQVKIYLYPDEGGGWHVHLVRKSDKSDLKIGLWDFELKRPTKFDRKTVLEFQKWVKDNRHYLRKKWVKNVLDPMKIFKKQKRRR